MARSRVQQSKRSLNVPVHSLCMLNTPQLTILYCHKYDGAATEDQVIAYLLFFLNCPLPPTNAPHLTPEDDLNNFKLPLPAEMSTKVTAFLANRGLKRSFNYTCVYKNSKSVKSTPPKDTLNKK